jgi:hypothetical protein
MQTQSPNNPFDYLSAHWAHMLGWSALITFLYRMYLGFKKFWGFGEGIAAAKSDLELIKTNHLPHLQAEVEKVNDNLLGLREDLKENFSRLSDDIRIVLTRMQ